MNYEAIQVLMTKRLMTVDVQGKINSVNRFKSNALLPLYEAVVNSIYSIENSDSQPLVKVKLFFMGGVDEGSKTLNSVLITDYGAGFNDDNLDSFLKSDSTFNSRFGCKGVGRFTWLCAFDKAHIRSVYEENGVHKIREFDFTDKTSEIEMIRDGDDIDESVSTVVSLIGFKTDYKKLPTAYKKTKTIAEKILLHCFEFFVANSELEVLVGDEEGNESCRQILKEIDTSSKELFSAGSENFTITHVRMPEKIDDHPVNQLLICGNNRVVERFAIDILGKKPFVSENKNYYYFGFISGKILDSNVGSDRTHFLITGDTNLDSGNEITISQIRKAAMPLVEKYLNEHFEEVRKEKKIVLDEYMVKFPEYKAICSGDYDIIIDEMKPNSKLEDINDIVSTRVAKDEFKSRERIDKILSSTKKTSVCEIEKEVDDEIERLKDSNKLDLIRSVVRRDRVLKLFEKKLEYVDTSEGRYSKEEAVHDILFPRRNYSDSINFDDFNLWIVDERLLYHSFATSDIPLKDYLNKSDSEGRPDIMIAMTKEHSRVSNSVCIVELKRPMRKNQNQSPVSQMLGYVKEIRSKDEINDNGRPIVVNDLTLYYCYALCDLTPAIREDAEMRNMHKLPDDLGYYMYNDILNAYVEIMSYDKLLNNAYVNNSYMFRKLGLDVPKAFDPTN